VRTARPCAATSAAYSSTAVRLVRASSGLNTASGGGNKADALLNSEQQIAADEREGVLRGIGSVGYCPR
jgi:hypothetical protein